MLEKIETNLTERLLTTMGSIEKQVENIDATVKDLTKTVNGLTKSVTEFNIQLKQIEKSGTHSPLECQQMFDKRYLQKENAAEFHNNLHTEMLKSTNLKANTAISVWKVIGYIIALGTFIAIALQTIANTGVIQNLQ